jgi:hypothetical protein
MDAAKAQYVVRYYEHLMTVQERLAQPASDGHDHHRAQGLR